MVGVAFFEDACECGGDFNTVIDASGMMGVATTAAGGGSPKWNIAVAGTALTASIVELFDLAPFFDSVCVGTFFLVGRGFAAVAAFLVLCAIATPFDVSDIAALATTAADVAVAAPAARRERRCFTVGSNSESAAALSLRVFTIAMTMARGQFNFGKVMISIDEVGCSGGGIMM